MFSFTVSSNTATLDPNGSVSIVITQSSTDPQAVTYGVSTQYQGGWDSHTFIDEHGNVSASFSPTPAKITGSGTMTLTFSASSSVVAQTLIVTVYGLQQMTGDPNSAINQSQTVTLTIT